MYSKLILWKVSDYCKYFMNFIVLNLISTFKLEKSKSLLFISLTRNLHQLIHCIVDINCSIKMCNLLNREANGVTSSCLFMLCWLSSFQVAKSI